MLSVDSNLITFPTSVSKIKSVDVEITLSVIDISSITTLLVPFADNSKSLFGKVVSIILSKILISPVKNSLAVIVDVAVRFSKLLFPNTVKS